MPGAVIVTLPWPDKRLSPNARLHWRAKVGPKQAARIASQHYALASKGFYSVRDALKGTEGPIPVAVRFYPPDRRHRDDDNMIGSLKSHRDGIAEVLGVDDRRFRPHYFFEQPEKPGRIEFEILDTAQSGVKCSNLDSSAVNGLPQWKR